MADFVFLGPSLSHEEAAALLPGARIHPPVAHGDLLRLAPRPGDRVLIIDGLFLHQASVRHREILLLLERGVTVAGSSSMGALRAAELWQFGMRGAGEVFRLYSDGVITGDDEVAVVHGPVEDGTPLLSEPLVNIRTALWAAAAAGAVTAVEADALIAVARDIPFRLRSYRALAERTRVELGGDSAERFLHWYRRNPTDVKSDDARLLLSMAAAGSPELRPADAHDDAIQHVHTRYLVGWRAAFEGQRVGGAWVSTRDVLVALKLLHPRFPELHRRQVLARLAGCDPLDADVADRALAAARDRGLVGTGSPVDLPGPSWLTGADRSVPVREATLRLLARAFGAVETRKFTADDIPPALRCAEVLDAARWVVATARTVTETMPSAGHAPNRRKWFRAEVVDRTFADLWGCDVTELTAAVWDRGFRELDQFRALAEPLVGYLKLFGRPEFPERTPATAAAAG